MFKHIIVGMYYTVGTYVPLGKKKEEKKVSFLCFAPTRVLFVKTIEGLHEFHVKTASQFQQTMLPLA